MSHPDDTIFYFGIVHEAVPAHNLFVYCGGDFPNKKT